MQFKILIVDDDDSQRNMLEGFLQKQDYSVEVAANGKDAIRIFHEYIPNLVLLDRKMPGMDGDELLAELKEINPHLRAIMITAFADLDTAVKVMKLGADDFLEKPVDLGELCEKIKEIERDFETENDIIKIRKAISREHLPVKMIGSSDVMTNLLSLINRIAPSPWTVLINGETGTGKELVARLIHFLSARKEAELVEVNCAAIPDNLFESELFGHEKGSFTGADTKKKGRFELADGGTLFLDEIAELPLNMQAKLLRVIQEGNIRRVGGEKNIDLDVRVIAATNRDLKQMVADGEFREDLYYRLNVLEVFIPPLRDRKADIKELIEHFLVSFSKEKMVFLPESLAIMTKYPYPGNVRELKSIIQRVVVMARETNIKPEDLPKELSENGIEKFGTLDSYLQDIERKMLYKSLEKFNWVQTRAAEDLGISERTIRYKMKKLGIIKK